MAFVPLYLNKMAVDSENIGIKTLIFIFNLIFMALILRVVKLIADVNNVNITAVTNIAYIGYISFAIFLIVVILIQAGAKAVENAKV